MSDSQGKDRRNTFWTVLGALLAIFGAAFAVVTYIVPVESAIEKLALSLVVVSVSILIFRAIQVLLAGRRIDPFFSALAFVTVGLMVWYTVILAASREAKIATLEQQTRTLEQQASTNGRDEPTPTATPWPSRSETTFPSETESAVEQGSAIPQAPKTSIPSEAPLPSFAPSAEQIYSTGTATLYLGGYGIKLSGWHRHNGPGNSGQIMFTEAALVGHDKTQLGLLTEGSDTSFATCRDHTAWTPAINWQQVRRGSFACLRWNGLRGILRIDTIPDFDKRSRSGENAPSVVLTGVVWDRIVDR
ncbi:MAG: hypothetical protein ACRDSF_11810 [Pseudonocardiaceae bacterium]